MANYKHDNTFIFKNKNINVSVHPFIEEHLKSLKKNVSKLPVSNSIIPILIRKQRGAAPPCDPVWRWVSSPISKRRRRAKPAATSNQWSGMPSIKDDIVPSPKRTGEEENNTLLTQRNTM